MTALARKVAQSGPELRSGVSLRMVLERQEALGFALPLECVRELALSLGAQCDSKCLLRAESIHIEFSGHVHLLDETSLPTNSETPLARPWTEWIALSLGAPGLSARALERLLEINPEITPKIYDQLLALLDAPRSETPRDDNTTLEAFARTTLGESAVSEGSALGAHLEFLFPQESQRERIRSSRFTLVSRTDLTDLSDRISSRVGNLVLSAARRAAPRHTPRAITRSLATAASLMFLVGVISTLPRTLNESSDVSDASKIRLASLSRPHHEQSPPVQVRLLLPESAEGRSAEIRVNKKKITDPTRRIRLPAGSLATIEVSGPLIETLRKTVVIEAQALDGELIQLVPLGIKSRTRLAKTIVIERPELRRMPASANAVLMDEVIPEAREPSSLDD